MIKIILFDVDNTLYPKDSGLFNEVDKRINKYLEEFLNIPENNQTYIRKKYFYKYGTTLNGLMIHHNVNPIEYLEYVHNVPVENFIEPNPNLKSYLEYANNIKKIIFSNAYNPYIFRILNCLEIKNYFEKFYDIVKFNFVPKPLKEPYINIFKKFNVKPEEVLIVDDAEKNLETAAMLGMKTAFLNNYQNKQFDFNIKKIEEMKEIHKKLIDF